MQPAADMARRGVEMTAAMRLFLVGENQPGLPNGPAASFDDGGVQGALCRANGQFFEVGEMLRYPEMADTIEAVGAGGADIFYRSDIAEVMVADLGAWVSIHR